MHYRAHTAQKSFSPSLSLSWLAPSRRFLDAISRASGERRRRRREEGEGRRGGGGGGSGRWGGIR